MDARTAFINPNEKILSHALVGMMDRTLLSNLVPEEVKQRQILFALNPSMRRPFLDLVGHCAALSL